jgi:SecD/SecF fusion protein
VEKVIREEVNSAIDNSFNVVRTRIDQFGVVQPNIQKVQGAEGRIMVEMPGIREPERMRKLLQGSANLEFWETYNAQEIAPYLQQLDSRLANGGSESDTTKTSKEATTTRKLLPRSPLPRRLNRSSSSTTPRRPAYRPHPTLSSPRQRSSIRCSPCCRLPTRV